MKIAILGYGSQGQAAVTYWREAQPDAEFTVCDLNPDLQLPDGLNGKLGPDYLAGLDQFDLLVRTPSLHPHDISAANPESPDVLSKVTTVTNEFFRVCPTKNIIGVTGTKGKGTTSTLITRILEAAGKTAHLGGNIGVPPLDMLKNGIQADDWVVLELANFQLIDLQYAPVIGVCVMVMPEHLDWHKDLDEYIASKAQMFLRQTAADTAVFNRLSEYSQKIASASPGIKISYEVPPAGEAAQEKTGAYVEGDTIYMNQTAICKTSDVALRGRHNLENVCAAIAATWEVIGQDVNAIATVLKTLDGLPNRLELVAEIDGVKYYDDSLGTTPETAIAALQAFDEPKVMILGGSNKGATFDELAKDIAASTMRAVVMIEGDTATQIREALQSAGYANIVSGGTTMTEIVQAAHDHAQSGDVVLLSTACASFGLFKNYKDRGDQFKAAVQALASAAQ